MVALFTIKFMEKGMLSNLQTHLQGLDHWNRENHIGGHYGRISGARALLKEFLAGVNPTIMHDNEVINTIIKTGHFVAKKSTFIFAR